MNRRLYLLCALFFFAGCANQPPKLSTTPWPQAIFESISQSETKSRMMGAFAQTGAIVEDETDSMITGYFPITGGTGATLNLLGGSGRSSAPRDYFRMIMTQSGKDVLVVAQFWRAIEQYNGTWDRVETQQNSNIYNNFQQILWAVKDKVAAENRAGERNLK